MFKDNMNILLVDDEAFTRKLMEERISKIPGVTIAASLSNGFSAKNFMLEHEVDLVITDIMMPLMDGLELSEFISNFDVSCQVVIISGYSEFEYARKALQFGVKDYLSKPIQFSQLTDLVDKSFREIKNKRRHMLTQLYSIHEELESKLYRTFVNNASCESWLDELKNLMVDRGTVVRIAVLEEEVYKKVEMSIIFKNILSNVLPEQIILRMGYIQGQYDYLILTLRKDNQRSIKSVPEYLDRVLEKKIEWTEICTVSTPQELSLISEVYIFREEKNELIQKACRYMEEHLGKQITRDEVADSVCLSSPYFSSLFKKVTGMGYNEYLTEIRINRAKKMLEKNLPIREIGEAVGFHDPKYFRDVFGKRTGCTPTEYRRKILNGTTMQGKTYE